MSQTFEQSQQLQQSQVLAAYQIAVAKLVELPINELAVRVKDELAENAALEEEDGDLDFAKDNSDYEVTDAGLQTTDTEASSDSETNGESLDDDASDSREDATEENAYEENSYEENSYEDNENYGTEADAMGDYFSDDDVPDYLQQRAEEQRERNENLYYSPTSGSFYEDLQEQLAEQNLTEHESMIMEYIVGSLDPDGLLRKDIESLSDELAIYHGVMTDLDELQRLLTILQHLEPKGLGASSLKECLLIQLQDMVPQTPYVRQALEIVRRYFREFADHRWEYIKQRLGLTDEDFAHVRHVLTHLNPLPGAALSDAGSLGAPALIPDVLVNVTDDGEIEVSLNKGDVPELRISPAFRDTLKQYGGNKPHLSRAQRDAYVYAKQKVDSAQNFLQMLQRRQQIISQVAQLIVTVQRDFFLNEDEESLLHPFTIREVARQTGWSESVLSRVSNTKYLQTPHNIYPFKYFFSRSISNQREGEELISRHIRLALQDILEKEDHETPYSDDQLATLLGQAGYPIARRTVAKYREIMGYPTARTRKEMYRNGDRPVSK